MYKRGTPEYEKWKASSAYKLYCERISVAMTGKHSSVEARAKNSAAKTGERHPMYGKHHSEETRAKISTAMTDKHQSVETRRKHSEAISGKRHYMYGKHHSIETHAKIRVAKIGKRNPNYGKHPSAETCAKISAAKKGQTRPDLSGPNSRFWRGGVSFDPYPVGWTALLRRTIRKRDNYTCVLCEEVQIMPRHDVHHINYEKEDLRPENLVTLCADCHRKINGDREYWENLFVMIYVPDFQNKEEK